MIMTPPNPYPSDSAEAGIWEMCVLRDIHSFVRADWSICAGDFDEGGFTGWNARHQADPRHWELSFPTLGDYRRAWQSDAEAFRARCWAEDPATALFRSLRLERVEIRGDHALVHKRFEGSLTPTDGDSVPLRWQSLFILRRKGGPWKQGGFVGYLPLT